MKSHAKVQNGQDLTYFEKSIYQRLFFMKPYITNTKQDDELSKYETMSCIKINESVSDATVREEKEYLTKVRDNQVIKNNVTILNDIITDYPNNEMQNVLSAYR